MASDAGEGLIFGRFTRDECGLPPRGRSGRARFVLRAAALLALLLAAGWVAGTLNARRRAAWVGSLPYLVQRADSSELPELMARGRLYAAALSDDAEARRGLALANLAVAGDAPRRMGYYGNLAGLYAGLENAAFSTPLAEFHTLLSASGVYAELGEYERAFEALAAADTALSGLEDADAGQSYNMLLVNAQAYYLAIAPVSRGGNPERALHLAQLLVSSRDELPGGGYASDSAAFLDTLATAWFATGDAEKALAAQVFALGLAEPGELDVYLRHYDEFFLETRRGDGDR